MLSHQGLTELIHSSPSEQVAYLLVERASLLETSEVPDKLMGDENTTSLLGTEAQLLKTTAHQVRGKTPLCLPVGIWLCDLYLLISRTQEAGGLV